MTKLSMLVLLRNMIIDLVTLCTAGVTWFTQMSAAMGEDPGKVFRQCITSLGQQDVLKPPYNHASRQEVGLQQHW